MKLQDLLKGVAVLESTAAPDTEINEVRYDSRAVRPATCSSPSAAMRPTGTSISAKRSSRARRRSCARKRCRACPAVVVENARRALAEIAANRFGHPADSMVMLGVTGTNGKTTTTYLVKHMLEDAGRKVGLIGTNQNLIGDEVVETERTTPESYELHALFARMRDAGCTHVIMEVSSALARARPRARHPLCSGRVHQPDAGPSGLPQDDGGIPQGKGAAVHHQRPRASSIWTIRQPGPCWRMPNAPA